MLGKGGSIFLHQLYVEIGPESVSNLCHKSWSKALPTKINQNVHIQQ